MITAATGTKTATKEQFELFTPTVLEVGEDNELHECKDTSKTLTLNRAVYSLAGAYPFLFDVIGYVLSHKEYKAAFYEESDIGYTDKIAMPWDILMDIAIGGNGRAIEEFFIRELKELADSKPYKTVWLSDTTVFQGILLSVNIHAEFGKEIPNIKRRSTDRAGIEMVFLKELANFTHGYVQRPKAAYARLASTKTTITFNTFVREIQRLNPQEKEMEKTRKKLIQMNPEDKTLYQRPLPRIIITNEKEGTAYDLFTGNSYQVDINQLDVRYLSTVNRLWNYIYTRDNGQSEWININIKDALPYFRPEYVRLAKNGNIYVKNIKCVLQAINEAMNLIEKANIGLTNGRNIIGHRLGIGIADGLQVQFDRTAKGKDYKKDNSNI